MLYKNKFALSILNMDSVYSLKALTDGEMITDSESIVISEEHHADEEKPWLKYRIKIILFILDREPSPVHPVPKKCRLL